MRMCFVVLLATTLPLRAMAVPVSPAEVLHHIGAVMTVEGVASITTPSTGTVTFVEVSVRGNNAILRGVIYDGDHAKFSDLAGYNGKKVQLTGPVQTFKGALRIILRELIS
jgi:hypothetical protein